MYMVGFQKIPFNQNFLYLFVKYKCIFDLIKRDLPESIFTNELLIRFEEAGAILNIGTREKHLKILVENLPPHNRLLLQWLLIHFDNVVAHVS